jgi:hypothetical protein
MAIVVAPIMVLALVKRLRGGKRSPSKQMAAAPPNP